MDQAIGRVYQAIQDLGYAEDTLVIFTVDHGFPFFRAKGTLYDPGLKTALLMRCPRYGITGGKRYTQLISNIDHRFRGCRDFYPRTGSREKLLELADRQAISAQQGRFCRKNIS